MAALHQITFPDALSFSILENVVTLSMCVTLPLSYIETTKLQRKESLDPSLSGEKKLSGSSARCISYHMYQKSHPQKDFPFLIGRNLLERDWCINFFKIKFLTKFYKKKSINCLKEMLQRRRFLKKKDLRNCNLNFFLFFNNFRSRI